MKCTRVLLLLILCMFMSSCEPSGYQNNDWAAFTLIQYQCPYEGSYFSYSEILEQDDYGRTLFKFWDGSNLAYESDNGFLYMYAIIQKDTDEWVWFYDTVCYMIQPSWADFTEDRLSVLKERNDWNREIDLSQANKVKCVSNRERHITISYSISSIEKIISSISKSNEYINYLPIANDQNGKTLFFIRTYTRDEQWNITDFTAYAVIMNADGSFSDNSIVKLEDFYDHTAELIALKESVGWSPITQ